MEPFTSTSARNLLSNNDWRATLFDEMVKNGPEVPLVIKPATFACRAERLTWAGTGPNLSTPLLDSEGGIPDTDAGEEMDTVVSIEIGGRDVENRFVIYDPRSYEASIHKIAEPSTAKGVGIVIVSYHH
jgi:hypothetical protein